MSRYAKGGVIPSSPDKPRRIEVRSTGGYLLPRRSVERYGREFIEKLNRGKRDQP